MRETTLQYSFRLPRSLVLRVDRCLANLAAAGLEVTRTDVVRLLLRYSLDATGGEASALLRRGKKPRPKARADRRR